MSALLELLTTLSVHCGAEIQMVVVPEVFLAPGELSAMVELMFLESPVVSHDGTILCQTVPRVFNSLGRGVLHVRLLQSVVQQGVDL